jgi:hypothetical protein
LRFKRNFQAASETMQLAMVNMHYTPPAQKFLLRKAVFFARSSLDIAHGQ